MEFGSVISIFWVFEACKKSAPMNNKCTPSEWSVRYAVHLNNELGTGMYKALLGEPGNLVMSPLGLKAVLSMAWMGASEKTLKKLTEELRFFDDAIFTVLGLGALASSVQSSEFTTLDITNKIYVQQGFDVHTIFRNNMKTIFRSIVDEVDFSNNTECVQACINEWSERKTHSNITDTIDSIHNGTLLLAVTAAYFKGTWLSPFREQLTSSETFHLSSGKNVTVPMMFTRGDFMYGRIPEWDTTVLQLPYRDEAHSLVVLLPSCRSKMDTLETMFAGFYQQDILNRLQSTRVDVFLPRFHVETTLSLKNSLIKYGLGHIFEPGANFAGISSGEVYFHDVVQKVAVDVSEKGTGANGEEDFGVIPESNEVNTTVFKANIPFIFVIVDDRTGVILFLGRVMEPDWKPQDSSGQRAR